MNNIEVTKELIDDCINFIAGYKSDRSIRFYEVKNADFPNSLLKEKDKEKEIIELINNGTSSRATADKLNIAKGTVSRHVANYRNRIAFYYEYMTFYHFIEPVLNKPIADVIDNTNKIILKNCSKLGVVYIRDFINIFTHNNWNVVNKKYYPSLTKEMKKCVFDRIAAECYLLLAE
jgi:hypothetical protein